MVVCVLMRRLAAMMITGCIDDHTCLALTAARCRRLIQRSAAAVEPRSIEVNCDGGVRLRWLNFAPQLAHAEADAI